MTKAEEIRDAFMAVMDGEKPDLPTCPEFPKNSLQHWTGELCASLFVNGYEISAPRYERKKAPLMFFSKLPNGISAFISSEAIYLKEWTDYSIPPYTEWATVDGLGLHAGEDIFSKARFLEPQCVTYREKLFFDKGDIIWYLS